MMNKDKLFGRLKVHTAVTSLTDNDLTSEYVWGQAEVNFHEETEGI